MVLELLINPLKAEKKPWELFFVGAFYSSIAILLSLYIFRQYVGIVMIFITTLACTYLLQGIFRVEEKRDSTTVRSELSLLKEHGAALSSFMFLFLGFTVAFSVWYAVLPAGLSHQIFGVQEQTIQCINSAANGCVSGTQTAFLKIFMNNIRVLAFTLIFALFYGAGAVFILAWNAAVVGTAIGIFVRNELGAIAGNIGLASMAAYFSTYSIGLMKYMTHGAFEILAYFMAALAGGIISIAVIKHDFRSRQFRKVALDSVDLIALSVGMLFLAAIIEVFVTPLLF